jgi:sulfatase maturation enzyme AslB (radical SAM superfamily)
MDQDKKLKEELKQKFCKVPFEFVDLSHPPRNDVLPCCWVVKPIGFISETTNLDQIWNSPEAVEVRKSILDGSYKYCRVDDCPHIHNGQLPDKKDVKDPYHRAIIDNNITVLPEGPKVLHFNNDPSCNLSCPSCRKEKSLIVNGEEFEKRKRIWAHSITPEVLAETRELSITGSGDPFASKIYRDFLTTLDGSKYPNLKINLFTNGVLFTEKMWKSIEKIHHNIQDVKVSLDSMKKETYDIVRRGGDFHAALENVRHLSVQKSNGYFRDLVICFVVQRHNYKEMPAFVDFALGLKNVKVHFQRIINWGTFTEAEFKSHAIYHTDHPEHKDFIEVLKNPLFRNPAVDMGNLTKYL